MTHEIGHALGLGHEFPESALDLAFDSIMGYDDYPTVSAADAKAIQNLYRSRNENKKIVAGAYHHCALNSEGKVACWGSNFLEQLGTSVPTWEQYVHHPQTGPNPIVDLSAMEDTTCVVDSKGELICWGGNEWGAVPSLPSEIFSKAKPSSIGFKDLGIKRVFLGSSYGCFIFGADNEVQCWGRKQALLPADALKPLTGALEVFPHPDRICALLKTGTVHCVESKEAAPGHDLEGVFTGFAHSASAFCAYGSDTAATCGGLGLGLDLDLDLDLDLESTAEADRSIAAVNELKGLSRLAMSEGNGCGIGKGNEIQCWGKVTLGSHASNPSVLSPIPELKDHRPKAFALSNTLNCLLDENSEVYCWSWFEGKLTKSVTPLL